SIALTISVTSDEWSSDRSTMATISPSEPKSLTHPWWRRFGSLGLFKRTYLVARLWARRANSFSPLSNLKSPDSGAVRRWAEPPVGRKAWERFRIPSNVAWSAQPPAGSSTVYGSLSTPYL